MHAAAAELAVEIIRKPAAVAIEDALFGFRRDAEVLLFDRKAHAGQRKGDRFVRFRNGGRLMHKAFGIELFASCKRHDAVRTHAPCRQQTVRFQNRHAQNVIEKIEPRGHPVRLVDANGGTFFGQTEPVIELHAFGSPFVSMFLSIVP